MMVIVKEPAVVACVAESELNRLEVHRVILPSGSSDLRFVTSVVDSRWSNVYYHAVCRG